MIKQIENHIKMKLNQFVKKERINNDEVVRKLTLCEKRKAKILRVKAQGKIYLRKMESDKEIIKYQLRTQYYIKQKNKVYKEERVEQRKAIFQNQQLTDDYQYVDQAIPKEQYFDTNELNRANIYYDRMAAVDYANTWWDDYNPKYNKFEVDCTNYISQCLFAGGAPMRGIPDRTKGWWTQKKSWSFSWTVANALAVYLSHSTTGLRAKEVNRPEELQLGDVICYDFQGDGKYDHTTIVTNFDAMGMPLVNAHTTNSINRYWSYEDSTAYTKNIKYKFFSIVDD